MQIERTNHGPVPEERARRDEPKRGAGGTRIHAAAGIAFPSIPCPILAPTGRCRLAWQWGPGRRRGAGVSRFPFSSSHIPWMAWVPTNQQPLPTRRTRLPSYPRFQAFLASFSCLGPASLLFFSGPTRRFTWSVVLFVDHVLSRCRIPSSVAHAAVSHTLILPLSSSVDTRLGRGARGVCQTETSHTRVVAQASAKRKEPESLVPAHHRICIGNCCLVSFASNGL